MRQTQPDRKGHFGIFEGRGPVGAIFDNGLPEGRALNRTVTLVLEYEQK